MTRLLLALALAAAVLAVGELAARAWDHEYHRHTTERMTR
jgi:hypothetical protein